MRSIAYPEYGPARHEPVRNGEPKADASNQSYSKDHIPSRQFLKMFLSRTWMLKWIKPEKMAGRTVLGVIVPGEDKDQAETDLKGIENNLNHVWQKCMFSRRPLTTGMRMKIRRKA